MLRCTLRARSTRAVPPAPDPVELVASALPRATHVDSSFVSYTIDSAWLNDGDPASALANDQLVRLRAKHLAPFVLRVGGTREDFIQFTGSSDAPAPRLPELNNLPARRSRRPSTC